jgi:recombination protein RecR
MNKIDELAELFKEFPGIGPRQAKRFVYFLLRKNDYYTNKLIELIPELKKQTRTCEDCFRFFSNASTKCDICLSKNRNSKQLMIVSRDSDLETIERSDTYDGYYFVIGGILPVLEKEPEKFIRIKELLSFIEKKQEQGLEEIIIALSVNPEGDNTAEYIKKQVIEFYPEIKVSSLGRGLSTGLELEYSDRDTIKNALENRS